MSRAVSCIAVVALLSAGLAACSGDGGVSPTASPGSSTPPSPSTPGPSSTTPGPTAPKYMLAAESKLSIQALGQILTTRGGELSVTDSGGGSTQVTAQATGPDKKQLGWTVSMTISSAGRALSGSVIANGQNWVVVPNTGSIGTVISTSSVDIWTALAITVTLAEGDQTNNPMTILLKGTPAVTPSPQPSGTKRGPKGATSGGSTARSGRRQALIAGRQ